MNMLITGVLLWSIVHLVPSIAPSFRQRLIDKRGAGPYRGLFTAAIVIALALIILGWRSSQQEYLYLLPPWSRYAGFALMFLSFVLLGAANYKTVIRRYVRHPMLTGVFVWSVSHLLTNGTSRALVLFGVLGLWALIEIPLISAREGPRTLPEAPGLVAELKGLLISAIVFAVAVFLHPWFAGVSPLP